MYGYCIAYLISKGYTVSIPIAESQRYDLIFDDGQKLNKVEVKTCSHKSPSGSYSVLLKTCGGNKSGYNVKHFDPSSVDYLFVLTDDGFKYFIPTIQITNKSTLNITDKLLQFKVSV